MTQPKALMATLSDQPARDDRLDFEPYAKTLAEIIADPATDTPLTIGVFGGWGRGKTSLMQMVERRLEETTESAFPVHTTWFNAWLYSREAVLWRALIACVLKGTQRFNLPEETRSSLERLEGRLYQATEPANGQMTLPPEIIPGLGNASLPTLTGLELLRRHAVRYEKETVEIEALITDVAVSQTLTRRDALVALDDFRREFESLSEKCIEPCGRLVVFVDDLDRCLPDKAVAVLEAIKLFLDVPGFVFVLGVDRDVIEEGIRVRYADYKTELDGARYLEKIIQIPFNLPPIDAETVQTYVHTVTNGALPDARCETVFSVGLEPNPRRIKRTLNVFLLLWRLAQNRETLKEAIQPVRLAKVVIIQQYYPALFKLLTEGAHYLIDLERRFREEQALRGEESFAAGGGARKRAHREGETGTPEISAGPLASFLNIGLLRELLTCTAPEEPEANFSDLTPAQVQAYIYLTRSTEEEQAAEQTRQPFEPQMVTIPAGPFLMGTPEGQVDELFALMEEKFKDTKRAWVERETPQHEVTLPAYAIGRYPVTNAEFARFMEDGGYSTRGYWTQVGWQQKENDAWTQPRYWEDEKWNGDSQPVVGISWYEALAYCRWLSAKTGRTYRLPSEAEWEKAARGTDGRRYPWGETWDSQKCNNSETGPGHTTPMGQYPEGDSPYHVSEMVGQVWQWCSTRYGGTGDKPKFGSPYRNDDDRENLEGDDTRILRGGSWYNSAGHCRCGYRFWNVPWGWNFDWGFRCVRTLSS